MEQIVRKLSSTDGFPAALRAWSAPQSESRLEGFKEASKLPTAVLMTGLAGVRRVAFREDLFERDSTESHAKVQPVRGRGVSRVKLSPIK